MAKKKSTKTWKKFPKGMAVSYWRQIRPVTDRIRTEYKKTVEPELEGLLKFEYVEVPGQSMDDAITDKIGKIFRTFRINYYGQSYAVEGDPKTILFRTKLENVIKRASNFISKFHKRRFDENVKVLGVDPLKGDPGLKPLLNDWTAQNVSLIKDIPDSAIDKMERIVTNSVMRGDSRTYLKEQIANVLNISDTRAKGIARDQSSKLYGALTKFRSQTNGWNFYEWSDSNDSRVRAIPETNKNSDHRRLDGKIFKYSEPPVTILRGKQAGARNNPGQDYFCRCTGLPIVDPVIISLLKRQQDGSYAVPKTAKAA